MTEDNNKVRIVVEDKNKDLKPKKPSTKELVLDWLKTIAAALVIAVVIKTFIMDATKVAGDSMLNTLHHGDMLMVNKIGKRFSRYHRGDIVILEAPDYPGRLYVKRVVGVPGDTISLENEKVYVNGDEIVEPYTSADYTLPTSDITEWTLATDQYFVMGDNRLEGASNDSRSFGPVLKDHMVGHAFIRFYPFSDFGLIDNNPFGEK